MKTVDLRLDIYEGFVLVEGERKRVWENFFSWLSARGLSTTKVARSPRSFQSYVCLKLTRKYAEPGIPDASYGGVWICHTSLIHAFGCIPRALYFEVLS